MPSAVRFDDSYSSDKCNTEANQCFHLLLLFWQHFLSPDIDSSKFQTWPNPMKLVCESLRPNSLHPKIKKNRQNELFETISPPHGWHQQQSLWHSQAPLVAMNQNDQQQQSLHHHRTVLALPQAQAQSLPQQVLELQALPLLELSLLQAPSQVLLALLGEAAFAAFQHEPEVALPWQMPQ